MESNVNNDTTLYSTIIIISHGLFRNTCESIFHATLRNVRFNTALYPQHHISQWEVHTIMVLLFQFEIWLNKWKLLRKNTFQECEFSEKCAEHTESCVVFHLFCSVTCSSFGERVSLSTHARWRTFLPTYSKKRP